MNKEKIYFFKKYISAKLLIVIAYLRRLIDLSKEGDYIDNIIRQNNKK